MVHYSIYLSALHFIPNEVFDPQVIHIESHTPGPPAIGQMEAVLGRATKDVPPGKGVTNATSLLGGGTSAILAVLAALSLIGVPLSSDAEAQILGTAEDFAVLLAPRSPTPARV